MYIMTKVNTYNDKNHSYNNQGHTCNDNKKCIL